MMERPVAPQFLVYKMGTPSFITGAVPKECAATPGPGPRQPSRVPQGTSPSSDGPPNAVHRLALGTVCPITVGMQDVTYSQCLHEKVSHVPFRLLYQFLLCLHTRGRKTHIFLEQIMGSAFSDITREN